MAKIKSLDELMKVREAALKKQSAKSASGNKEIIVGMGTVGIASGARETLKAILAYIEDENLEGVTVRQTGNLGLDSMEPVIKVKLGEEAEITYIKVTPEIMKKIMKEHIVGGKEVKDYSYKG
ncbi:MAG: (2Fe-2S) ferredoxin domain-containing protein [Anaerolineaceae bacterium]|nr:(2Fe-2S) ferredoxin domain-containing protein [Anaerolineaceae bacterium]